MASPWPPGCPYAPYYSARSIIHLNVVGTFPPRTSLTALTPSLRSPLGELARCPRRLSYHRMYPSHAIDGSISALFRVLMVNPYPVYSDLRKVPPALSILSHTIIITARACRLASGPFGAANAFRWLPSHLWWRVCTHKPQRSLFTCTRKFWAKLCLLRGIDLVATENVNGTSSLVIRSERIMIQNLQMKIDGIDRKLFTYILLSLRYIYRIS